MSDKTSTESSKVDQATVYSEIYNEMRRFRDYEFASSTWYTALLLAILGFLVATRFGSTAPEFAKYLDSSFWMKIGVVGGASLIAAASSFLVCYSYKRYRELRDWMDTNLEPPWKQSRFLPRKYKFVPRHIYYTTPWIIVVVIFGIICM